jgi:hypothetical protein
LLPPVGCFSLPGDYAAIQFPPLSRHHRGGNNSVNAGSGDDSVTTEDGSDRITVGDGDNVVDAGDGNNQVTAGGGDDRVTTGRGSDRINAGDGDNVVNAGGGNNQVITGRGNDRVTTGSGHDNIAVGDGDNVVEAGRGNDRVTAGRGDDVLDGGAGDDRINAGAGDDTIRGGSGTDVIDAGAGDDVVVVDVSENSENRSDDRIEGGSGDDTLRLDISQEEYESGAFDDALFEVKDFLADVQDGTVDADATGRFDDLNVRASGFESVELSVDGQTVELNRKPVVRGLEPVQIDFSPPGEPVEASAAQAPAAAGEDATQVLDESAGGSSGSEEQASAGQGEDDTSDGGEATTALLSQVEISDSDREDNLESATVKIDNLGEGAEVLFDVGDAGIEVKVEHTEDGGIQITFEGSADPAAYTTVLQSVGVKNDTVSQDGGSHEISVTVSDEHGVESDPVTADLEIIEDPAVVVETDSSSARGVEGAAVEEGAEGGSDALSAAAENDDEASDDSANDSGSGSGSEAAGETETGDSTSPAATEETGDQEAGATETPTDPVTAGDGTDDVGGVDDGGDEEDFALYAELDGGSDSSPDWMTVSEQPAEDAVVSGVDDAVASGDDWSGGDTAEVSESTAGDDLDSSIQIATLV